MGKKSTLFGSARSSLLLVLSLILLSGTVLAGEIRINNGSTEVRITANTYQVLSLSVSLSSLQYRNVQTKLGPFSGQHYLLGDAIRCHKNGPQAFMARDHIGKCSTERVDVEAAGESQRHRHVVDRGRPLQLIEKP